MLRHIVLRENFEKYILNSTDPYLIIFYDSSSDNSRIKEYQKIVNDDYQRINAFKINLDDGILTDDEEKKYVRELLICCIVCIDDKIVCERNPNRETFTQLLNLIQNKP